MPSSAQSSPPLSSRPRNPALRSISKETELDTNTYYMQQQALLERFFAPVPHQRSDHLIRSLHRYTLVHGLNFLQQRIEAIIDLGLKLYYKYGCFLFDCEVAKGAYLYTG